MKEEVQAQLGSLMNLRQKLADECAEAEIAFRDKVIQLKELDKAISHIMRSLGVNTETDDVAGLGLTDAIRKIFTLSKEKLSPNQVQEELAKRGFDFSVYGNPMASVYKVLSRLDGDFLVSEKDGWNIFYRIRPRGGRRMFRRMPRVPTILIDETKSKEVTQLVQQALGLGLAGAVAQVNEAMEDIKKQEK